MDVARVIGCRWLIRSPNCGCMRIEAQCISSQGGASPRLTHAQRGRNPLLRKRQLMEIRALAVQGRKADLIRIVRDRACYPFGLIYKLYPVISNPIGLMLLI